MDNDECVNIHDLVSAINRGATDPKVKGLFLNLGVVHASLTMLQELRNAIQNFRATHKPTILYANTIGESSNAFVLYWFASIFEFIYCSPNGYINFLSWRHTALFFKDAAERIGVEFHLETRSRYKTFANTFTKNQYTDEHRESDQHIIDEILSQILNDIAASRGITTDEVRKAFEDGPHNASSAKSVNLITDIMYECEFYDEVIEKHFQRSSFFNMVLGPRLIFWNQLYKQDYALNYFSPKVALIQLNGMIHMGESQKRWDGSFTSIGAKTVVEILDEIIDSKSFKAIVVRIDSRGGSALASDLINNALSRARKNGILVVTSMSQFAASGGYYVAAASDKIYAEPLTLTGSIGVVAGKVQFSNLMKNLSVSFEQLKTSDSDGFYDTYSGFNESEQNKLENMLDDIYNQFKLVVSKGRNLPLDTVEILAQGRVWTGMDAVNNGLVDEIGGLQDSIKSVKNSLKTSNLKIVRYPKPFSFWQLFERKKARNLKKKSAANGSWLNYLVCYSVNFFACTLSNWIGKNEFSLLANIAQPLFSELNGVRQLLVTDSAGNVRLPPSTVEVFQRCDSLLYV